MISVSEKDAWKGPEDFLTKHLHPDQIKAGDACSDQIKTGDTRSNQVEPGDTCSDQIKTGDIFLEIVASVFGGGRESKCAFHQ
jgi:hypothetical protein